MAKQPPFRPSPVFNTQLDPLTEMAFQSWVKNNNVPFNTSVVGPTDYDMRGYYQGLMNGNPQARASEVNPNDNRLHYPDYYKTPLHQTFSGESQWGTPADPTWINGSQLASPNGRVVFDEKAAISPMVKALMGMK